MRTRALPCARAHRDLLRALAGGGKVCARARKDLLRALSGVGKFDRKLTLVDSIGGPLDFWRPERTSKKKYLYGKNELAANFHVIWFIFLLLLSSMRYP